MIIRRLATTLAMASYLMLPAAALAKGGHGSHASGGHGGHASGAHGRSHSSGSHASGQSHGGQSHGGTTSHGATSRGSGATPATSSTHAVPTAPTGSRSRDGRPVTGTAVERSGVPPVARPFFFYPSYGFASYNRVRLGFGGLGFSQYPFWPGYGYGTYGYAGDIYDDAPGYAYPSDPSPAYPPPQPSAETGTLRLVIEPPTAQVYVDGSFVGTVEESSGARAGLALAAGPHRIELRAPGYETLTVDVMVPVNRTITYRGEMRRIPPPASPQPPAPSHQPPTEIHQSAPAPAAASSPS
jgi:hypothetical protein